MAVGGVPRGDCVSGFVAVLMVSPVSGGPSGAGRVPRSVRTGRRSGVYRIAARSGRIPSGRGHAVARREQQRTWRAWLAVTELLPRTLDAQLQRDAGLTHAAYVVLAMLSEAPDRTRRMSDLARAANQSQSRLSHTVARLEERGWVRRERATEDRRGNLAVLTDAGWDVVLRVAPGHVAAVPGGAVRRPHPEQTRALGDVLSAVLERLDPDATLRVPDAG